MTVLVSACLLGLNCKYSGGNNRDERVCRYVQDKTVICVCPEVMGGLPVPRTPCERSGDRVVDRNGTDRTEAFEAGVRRILECLDGIKIDLAVLQPRIPSCGRGELYDGTFSGKKIPGNGLFAEALIRRGIPVLLPDEV